MSSPAERRGAGMGTMGDAEDFLLEAALRYAERGIPVFPVDRATKRPLTPHGFKDATIDADQITQWWIANPTANIAVPTGQRIGLLVVDVDPRHGGDETLSKLSNGHSLPGPLTKTGGGGEHRWFRHDERFSISAGKNALAGLDTRGEGGYVVVAPSLHASGARYEGEVPNADEAGPLPEWLAQPLLAAKKESIETSLTAEPVKEGGR